MKKITIYNIADFFLSKESMTNKKLQKLCYYAQAWHLALLNKKLFEENFLADVYGPLNVNLNKKYKNYNWKKIPKRKIKNIFSEETLNLLESIVKTYIKYNASELEYLTMNEIPWIEARKGIGEWEKTENIINEETMKKYYKSILKKD